jgi:uracil-DNA glycosylase
MIVAMDPKRNSGEKNKISLNSVFSLHDSENGRDTKINDYWKFIQPLTENNFVYVTDAYKVYYEKTEGGKKIISNKDHNFKGKKTDSLLIHRKILQQEISLVKPKKIIAIGNEAIAAVKLILDVQSDQSIVEKNDVYYVFMPHTVRTVTNQVSSMGRLFECIRHIKDDEELENIGKTILANQNKLFLKKNSHE